jgi:hypothetical protein
MSLEWFPRVLGSRCGRYTVIANRTRGGAWNYLPSYSDGGIATPLGAIVDTADLAKERCELHAQPPRGLEANTAGPSEQTTLDLPG